MNDARTHVSHIDPVAEWVNQHKFQCYIYMCLINLFLWCALIISQHNFFVFFVSVLFFCNFRTTPSRTILFVCLFVFFLYSSSLLLCSFVKHVVHVNNNVSNISFVKNENRLFYCFLICSAFLTQCRCFISS